MIFDKCIHLCNHNPDQDTDTQWLCSWITSLHTAPTHPQKKQKPWQSVHVDLTLKVIIDRKFLNIILWFITNLWFLKIDNLVIFNIVLLFLFCYKQTWDIWRSLWKQFQMVDPLLTFSGIWVLEHRGALLSLLAKFIPVNYRFTDFSLPSWTYHW